MAKCMYSWCVTALTESRAMIFSEENRRALFVPRHPRHQTCLARSPSVLTRHPVARIAPQKQHIDGMHELSSGVALPYVGGSCPSAGQMQRCVQQLATQRTAESGGFCAFERITRPDYVHYVYCAS